MSNGDLKVSRRGQMSLPATARHRWGLDEGGEVCFLDLGDAILLLPGALSTASPMLEAALAAEGQPVRLVVDS